MTYRDFARTVLAHGVTPCECSRHHWQILGGRRLVNVWANSKRGFRFQVRDGKAQTGTLADAIREAGPPPPPPPDVAREAAILDAHRRLSENLVQQAEPHCGAIRRFWRWLW